MRIDCHVHVVGNGFGGTGCWYRPRGITRYGVPFMLRNVGLTRADLRGDLDGRYARQLLRFVRESSLDAAVILAQDEPHRENGERIENVGSFYVPNDFVLGLARRYPRLYGDNSALAGMTLRARPATIRRLQEPELAARILHGSDLPVPTGAAFMWAAGVVPWRAWRATAAIANPLERDAQIKRAMGFGEGTFTRLAGLLRRRPGGAV